jgi:hypothetical protein
MASRHPTNSPTTGRRRRDLSVDEILDRAIAATLETLGDLLRSTAPA